MSTSAKPSFSWVNPRSHGPEAARRRPLRAPRSTAPAASPPQEHRPARAEAPWSARTSLNPRERLLEVRSRGLPGDLADQGASTVPAPARHHAGPGPRATASGEKDLFPARSAAARCQPYVPRSWTPVQDRPWLCLLKSSGLLLIGIPDASTCRSDVSLSPMCNFTAESRRFLGGDGEIRTPEGFYPQPS